MTGRALIVVALVAAAALVTDMIVAFAILDEWGDVGAVFINLVGYASILTLVGVGVATLLGWRKRAKDGR